MDVNNLIQEQNYNHKLHSTTKAADYGFKLLRGRWQRLKCLEMQKVANMTIAVKTCCILHNICINNPNYVNSNFFVEDDKNYQVSTYTGPLPYSSVKKRDMIAKYLEENVTTNVIKSNHVYSTVV